jgi:hypothetical protein
MGDRRSVRFVGRVGGAQYLVGRDVAWLARKLVAAALVYS